MKTRIIERTFGDSVQYVIQQKHFLFRWWWVDAWVNSIDVGCKDTFKTLKEAQDNLKYFNGSKPKEKVILSRKDKVKKIVK